jgi:hypothetical protein
MKALKASALFGADFFYGGICSGNRQLVIGNRHTAFRASFIGVHPNCIVPFLPDVIFVR